ncbi:ribosomal protein S2, flavodoxin-like domain-containing protein [Geranomyces variabilis]|nr:ribosomal protein S2, flavodoxin-like domain-containing protein [Geranomyces variabilis]
MLLSRLTTPAAAVALTPACSLRSASRRTFANVVLSVSSRRGLASNLSSPTPSPSPPTPTSSSAPSSPAAELASLIPSVSTLGSSSSSSISQRRSPHPTRMTLTVSTLVAANLHLGHARQSWNQNMLPYIYGERQGIHIINLEHTIVMLRRAINVTREVALRGGNILFVGTRPAIHRVTVEAARHADAYFATSWVGGTITNKERVLRRSVGYDPDKVMQTLTPPEETAGQSGKASSSRHGLKAQASAAASGEEDAAAGRRGNQSRAPKNPQPYVHTPDLLIILDYANNAWAVREANQANIPVIAICDTDCNPRRVQYPIPANDDSVTGVELIARALSMASREGSMMRAERLAEKAKEDAAAVATHYE